MFTVEKALHLKFIYGFHSISYNSYEDIFHIQQKNIIYVQTFLRLNYNIPIYKDDHDRMVLLISNRLSARSP